MEKVIFQYKILDDLDELVFIVFKKEYFSYSENAQYYVDKIVGFILSDIDSFPHKPSPTKLRYLGSYYVFYKSNQRTTWYVFFEKKNQNYLITGIINNHGEEAKEL